MFGGATHLVHHSASNDDIVKWVGAVLDLVKDVLEHLVGGLGGGCGGVLLLQVRLGQILLVVLRLVIVIGVGVKVSWARCMGVGYLCV